MAAPNEPSASPAPVMRPAQAGLEVDAPAARRAPRRLDGRRFALAFGAFLVLGTVTASAIAWYGHRIGAVARERYERARREASP